MEYYTATASERYALGQHSQPLIVPSYGDSFAPQSYQQDGVTSMYPPLHSYYSAGQCLPYTSQPAFVAPSASMYCSSAVTDTNMQFQYPQDPQPVQIHAPVPLSAYTSLLPGTPDSGSQPTPRPSAMPSPFEDVSQVTSGSSPSQERSPLDHYINAPPATFPTPCDLLNEMSSRDRLTCTVPSGASSSHQPPRDLPTALVSVKSKPERKQSEKRPENQRKAYFRTVAETVGFQPTNPDTITSHDKKRHYLECLEQYVLWLHELLRLVGKEPVPLKRITTSRGLDIRSMRVLLVHMQNETRKLNSHILQEEHRFLELKEQVLALQEGAIDPHSLDVRRHSIASGAISAAAVAAHGYHA